jgi:hypothetical protein
VLSHRSGIAQELGRIAREKEGCEIKARVEGILHHQSAKKFVPLPLPSVCTETSCVMSGRWEQGHGGQVAKREWGHELVGSDYEEDRACSLFSMYVVHCASDPA